MSALPQYLSIILVSCTFMSLRWYLITAITLPRLFILLLLNAAWVSLRPSSDRGSEAFRSTPDPIGFQLTNFRRSRCRSHVDALQLQLRRNTGNSPSIRSPVLPSSARAAPERELDDFGPSLTSPPSTPRKRLRHAKFVPKSMYASVIPKTTPLLKYRIGDERTDPNGERYRLDGDGVERRLCLVREMRLQHSMGSDWSRMQTVIVERWIADDEYQMLFQQRKLASQVTSEEEECEKAPRTATRRNASGQNSDEQATSKNTGPSFNRGFGVPSHCSSLPAMVSHLFPSHPNGRLRNTVLPPRHWTVIRAAHIIEDEAAAKRERDRRRQASVRLGDVIAPEGKAERQAAERSFLASSMPCAQAIEKDLNLPRASYHSETVDNPATPSSTAPLRSFALDAPPPMTHVQPFVRSAALTFAPRPAMQQKNYRAPACRRWRRL
ncbi:hypothetical protein JCM21900_005412 [Sporobolomyces salmonicolor]